MMKKSLKNTIAWILTLVLTAGMLPEGLAFAGDTELGIEEDGERFAEAEAALPEDTAVEESGGSDAADGAYSRKIDRELYEKINVLNGVLPDGSMYTSTSSNVPGNTGLDYEADLERALASEGSSYPADAPDLTLSADTSIPKYWSYDYHNDSYYDGTHDYSVCTQFWYYIYEGKAVICGYNPGEWKMLNEAINYGSLPITPLFWTETEVAGSNIDQDDGLAFINAQLGSGAIDGISLNQVSAGQMKLVKLSTDKIGSLSMNGTEYRKTSNGNTKLTANIYVLWVSNQLKAHLDPGRCVGLTLQNGTSLEIGYLYFYSMELLGIAEGAFAGYTSIMSVMIEKSDHPVYIGAEAFKNARLLGDVRLNNCYIGKSAFEGCFQRKSSSTLSLKDCRIADRAFKNCRSIGYDRNSALEIGIDGSIGIEAFYGCEYLKLLKIKQKNGVSDLKIGFGAFAKCDNLLSVTLENNTSGAKHILGDYAFYDTPALQLYTDCRNNEYAHVCSLGKACFAMSDPELDQSGYLDIGYIDLTRTEGTPSYTLYGADADLFHEAVQYKGAAGAAITSESSTGELKAACSYTSRIGDYLFANRGKIGHVAMHIDSNAPFRLPMNSFLGCEKLEYLDMQSTNVNRYAEFAIDANAFRDSGKEGFMVRNLSFRENYDPAQKDRVSTWAAYTKVSGFVPYRTAIHIASTYHEVGEFEC